MGKWICRTKVYWRDVLWVPGEPPNDVCDIKPFENRKWVYDGGAWVPEGVKVIDPAAWMLIPSQFEPADLNELANPRDVYLARNNKKTERTWRFKHEIEGDAPFVIEELPEPEPLTPEVVKRLKQDPDALVTHREPAKPKLKVNVQKVQDEAPPGMKKGPGGRWYPTKDSKQPLDAHT